MKSHLFSCHRDKILICQLLAIDLKRNAVIELKLKLFLPIGFIIKVNA